MSLNLLEQGEYHKGHLRRIMVYD